MSSKTLKSTIFAPVTQAVARKLAYLTRSSALSEAPVVIDPRDAPREASRPTHKFMTIAIVNWKGGAGKSAAAIALAAAANCAGERAAIIDCDLQQHTAFDWSLIRQRSKPKVVKVGAAKLSGAVAEAQRAGYTFVVVDTPGQDTPEATTVIRVCDLVVVPAPPTWADFQATLPLLHRLAEAKAHYAVLLTRVHKARVVRNDKFHSALAKKALVLDAAIPNRELFSDAAGAGLTVFDFSDAGAKDVARDVDKVYRELRVLGERLSHE